MRWRKIKQKKHNEIPTKERDFKNTIIYAGFWSRFMAFTTDIFMIGIPITIIIMIFFGYDQMHTAGFSDALMQSEQSQVKPPNPIASMVQLILYLSAFILFWKKSGQTPGMKMAGIKIVDASDFTTPSYLQLFARFFSYPISLLFFGYLWGLFSKKRSMLPDLISRTTLVYTKK